MRFWHCPKPTIAAVRGACLAGACELALACDLTIAAEDAFFGEPELKFGAGIVVMMLPWMVGPKIAKEIILTGEDRIERRAGRRDRDDQPRRAGRRAGSGRAASLPATSPPSTPTSSSDTKRAINRALEARGMLEALEEALDDRSAIEGAGSPDKVRVHGDRPPRRPEGGARLARCPLSQGAP